MRVECGLIDRSSVLEAAFPEPGGRCSWTTRLLSSLNPPSELDELRRLRSAWSGKFGRAAADKPPRRRHRLLRIASEYGLGRENPLWSHGKKKTALGLELSGALNTLSTTNARVLLLVLCCWRRVLVAPPHIDEFVTVVKADSLTHCFTFLFVTRRGNRSRLQPSQILGSRRRSFLYSDNDPALVMPMRCVCYLDQLNGWLLAPLAIFSVVVADKTALWLLAAVRPIVVMAVFALLKLFCGCIGASSVYSRYCSLHTVVANCVSFRTLGLAAGDRRDVGKAVTGKPC